MKKIVTILLLIITTFSLTACGKDDNKLVMATEAGFFPYEYYSDGKIIGVDVDIANEIAKKLGKELVIKDIAFDSIISEIKTGKSDIGAAGISYTKERAKQVDFTINYATSNQIVIVKKGSSIKSINDLNNKKIAVQLGTVADSYLEEKYKNATVTREKKFLACIEDLKSNKVDAVIMDEVPAKAYLNNEIIRLDEILFSDSYGMVVKTGNKELLEKANEVIRELQASGKIDEFLIKHMGS